MKTVLNRTLIGICITLGGYTGGVSAQTLPADPSEGYMLALDLCSSCHIVVASQKTPVPMGIPSFFEVANDKRFTELALRSFLQTSHQYMPNLRLKADDRDNVISYILSLRGRPIPPAPPLSAPSLQPEPEAITQKMLLPDHP